MSGKNDLIKLAAAKIKAAPSVWLDPSQLKEEKTKEEAPAQSLNDTYVAWKDSGMDKKAAGPLLSSLKPSVDAALRSYANSDEKLRTQANIIAMDAARRFNPKEGVQLNTFVMSHLRGLNRIYGERSQMVRVPERARLDWIRLERENRNLEIEKNREPTVDELADATGLSVKKIQQLREVNRGEAAEGQWLSERGASMFSRTDDPGRIWADYVYHELDPVDKKIYEWSTGYGGTKTIKKMEMAKKLGISAPAVSARINRIITKLQAGTNV